jgi:hypothetical protein
MSATRLPRKINDTINITNSQQDKMQIQYLAFVNLLDFLNTKINKAKAADELTATAKKELLRRMKRTDVEMETRDIISILDIMENVRVNEENKLVDLLKNDGKSEVNISGNGQPQQLSNLSEDDVKKAKETLNKMQTLFGSEKVSKLLSTVSGLKKSEFSEDEE